MSHLLKKNTEGQSGGVVDSDADGLSDAWEQSHFGDLSEDGSGDPDGDGYVNIEEVIYHMMSGSMSRELRSMIS